MNDNNIFSCTEETNFYSSAVRDFCLTNAGEKDTIFEFGAGDGTALISAIKSSKFTGEILSFELHINSCQVAHENAKKNNLTDVYKIRHGDFLKQVNKGSDWIISNPPYLPCDPNDIPFDMLWGGHCGNEITKQIIDKSAKKIVILIPSYSDPFSTLSYIYSKGYIISKWRGTTLKIGRYSSNENVLQRINIMATEGRSYFSTENYNLVAVLLEKNCSKTTSLNEVKDFISKVSGTI